jgi:hypothetical protein
MPAFEHNRGLVPAESLVNTTRQGRSYFPQRCFWPTSELATIRPEGTDCDARLASERPSLFSVGSSFCERMLLEGEHAPACMRLVVRRLQTATENGNFDN